MSDRHLYKAKRTDNGEWIEGYYVNIAMANPFIATGKLKLKESMEGHFAPEMHAVDPSTICQCTGLKDKNGKLIWENDIVRASGGVHGVIRFGKCGDMKTYYGFYVEWDKTQPYWRSDICYWQSDIRVIGSHIENPELLEGGAE